MAWCSTLRPNEIVIDDTYRVDPNLDHIHGRGLLPRDFFRHPFASGPTKGFDLKVLGLSEIKDRAREKEEKKNRISDLCSIAGLKCKDQDGTNYCWINAPVYCYEAVQVMSGEPVVYYSPASVGAPIKSYRNNGGWGSEGLEYMVAHGVVRQDLWPANAINRQYDNEASQADRAKNKVTEFYDLVPRHWEQLLTCLIYNIPVAIGLNWWAHEVTACDVVIQPNGDLAVRIRNSWSMDWGDEGYSILVKSKALPDDAVAPTVTYAVP